MNHFVNMQGYCLSVWCIWNTARLKDVLFLATTEMWVVPARKNWQVCVRHYLWSKNRIKTSKCCERSSFTGEEEISSFFLNKCPPKVLEWHKPFSSHPGKQLTITRWSSTAFGRPAAASGSNVQILTDFNSSLLVHRRELPFLSSSTLLVDWQLQSTFAPLKLHSWSASIKETGCKSRWSKWLRAGLLERTINSAQFIFPIGYRVQCQRGHVTQIKCCPPVVSKF